MGRQSKKKREVKNFCQHRQTDNIFPKVEYEQLWNVEDRNSRRLSSSDDEDTEEEAPGLSSSPLQVILRMRNEQEQKKSIRSLVLSLCHPLHVKKAQALEQCLPLPRRKGCHPPHLQGLLSHMPAHLL